MQLFIKIDVFYMMIYDFKKNNIMGSHVIDCHTQQGMVVLISEQSILTSFIVDEISC